MKRWSEEDDDEDDVEAVSGVDEVQWGVSAGVGGVDTPYSCAREAMPAILVGGSSSSNDSSREPRSDPSLTPTSRPQQPR
ncbi:unnamed protein product [Lampetra planeri]